MDIYCACDLAVPQGLVPSRLLYFFSNAKATHDKVSNISVTYCKPFQRIQGRHANSDEVNARPDNGPYHGGDTVVGWVNDEVYCEELDKANERCDDSSTQKSVNGEYHSECQIMSNI